MNKYEVRTEGTVWKQIVSYEKWKIDDSFLRFVFDDGMELILPINSVLSIYQKS